MRSSIAFLCLLLLVGCNASTKKYSDDGGAEGDVTQGGDPIVNLQDLNGIWASFHGTMDGLMPHDCTIVQEAQLPVNFRAEHPELPASLPGRLYVELKDGAVTDYWLVYPNVKTCIEAGFNAAGVKAVLEESTLVSAPGAFYDSDGLPVQQFQNISILDGGETFTMYVLLKPTGGTSSYREFLWSSSTKNVPFQSLQENNGWWIFRRP